VRIRKLSSLARRRRPFGSPGGAAAFAPTDIAGLLSWLKADAGTLQTSGGSTAVADGDPVGEWQDQSGSGNHFAQATGAARPTLKLAIQNGRSVARLDGTDDSMTLTLAVPQPFTVAMAIRCTNANNGYALDGATLNRTLISFPNGTTVRFFAGNIVDATVADSTVFSTLVALFDGASSVLRWNDAETAGNVSTGSNNGGFTLGSGGDGTQPFTGDVGEVLIYDSALSPADRASVADYLKDRWGTP
jgi:hypothetical protein